MATIEVKDLEKNRKLLKSSFKMWENTIKETTENMKNARNEDGSKKYSEDSLPLWIYLVAILFLVIILFIFFNFI